jgi:hypothetical protein
LVYLQQNRFATSDTSCWTNAWNNTVDWTNTDMDPATWNFLPLSSHMTGSVTISFKICYLFFKDLGIWATNVFQLV